MNIYKLFNLRETADSLEIMERCKQRLSEWTFETVFLKLNQTISTTQASVNIKRVYEEGEQYLKVSARILLNPESRQLYDAFLGAIKHPTNEKKKLTKAMILWYNSNNNAVKLGATMLQRLEITEISIKEPIVSNPAKRRKKDNANPICRQCRSQFDFNDDYLVLHCDCTTRTGHPDCMNSFKERVKGKCPVCRKILLVRYQISKYLFWQNKEKFKLIT
tara:strand:- start:333 stop:989 length:657 start_codon:yes stop_codon:yes gene_type:complete